MRNLLLYYKLVFSSPPIPGANAAHNEGDVEIKSERNGGKKMNPEKKFRCGAISATVWKNQTEKNGEIAEYRTVSFERNYKDKNGEWNTTNSLRINDLPRAILVLQKAYEYMALRDIVEE